ncbi:MAG: TIGR03936 family radical SAM-associated protein [Oscillospiraceae bacterium]|nr:TIGR03936 family radical SAM-associated protein [Oscillospiraceae bacterium]
MHRLAFSKTETARYISHLDLMRTFQRAFQRAGLHIKHTEGFHPHPFVSIPLPLPVGFSSACEVLEFALVGEYDMADVPARMNAALPAGITVIACYDAERPVKQLTYVNYIVSLEYNNGSPFGIVGRIASFFQHEHVVVQKRSKKAKSGFTEVDLIPLIERATVEERRDAIVLDLMLHAQNPGLNPQLVVGAIGAEIPDVVTPDYVCYHRRALFDGQMERWR